MNRDLFFLVLNNLDLFKQIYPPHSFLVNAGAMRPVSADVLPSDPLASWNLLKLCGHFNVKVDL